jgi:hypothetical protein
MRDLKTPLADSFFDDKSVSKKINQAKKKHVKMLNKYDKDFDKRLKKSDSNSLAESTIYRDTYKEKNK